jgi:pyrimidine operon attenuation protein/uracil phosphoribosyltransferase
MTGNTIEKKIDELVDEVVEKVGAALKTVAIIGIRTGGEALAAALQAKLEKRSGFKPPLGMMDITLYRDDLDLKEGPQQPVVRATAVPFAIDGKRLILVDDVLYTGRTVRAALDALCDLGRPAKIDLLVMVDRGLRELPIQPDFCGVTMQTTAADHVELTHDAKRGWSLEVRRGT